MISEPHWTRSYPLFAIALLAAIAFADPVLANHGPAHEGAEHGEHGQHHAATPKTGAIELQGAAKDYEDAMQKMHKDMAIPYTNDVDVDFVRGMIPHHQGAIDQGNILLKYSKNLRIRRLAQGIIAAQKREIRFMEKWLNEHDQGVESADMPAWMKEPPPPSDDDAPSQR